MTVHLDYTNAKSGPIPTWDWDALDPWLPILGPTATIVLNRLSRTVFGANEYSIDLDQLAAHVGVAPSVLDKALTRLSKFGPMLTLDRDEGGTIVAIVIRATAPEPSDRARNRAALTGVRP